MRDLLINLLVPCAIAFGGLFLIMFFERKERLAKERKERSRWPEAFKGDVTESFYHNEN